MANSPLLSQNLRHVNNVAVDLMRISEWEYKEMLQHLSDQFEAAQTRLSIKVASAAYDRVEHMARVAYPDFQFSPSIPGDDK